jgi:N-acetylglucosaminyldiphosphoundecaprenol N-acetyl-beta-D-mannosaminyltransferase
MERNRSLVGGASNPGTAPNRDRVLGHPVNALSNPQALGLMVRRATEGPPGAYVCLTNVATTTASRKSPAFRTAVEGSYISLSDGMPLVWILRRRGFPGTEKLTGADLMPRLARAGLDAGLRHFLYGWTNRIAQAAARGLEDEVPGTLIVGTHCPPFAAAQEQGPDDLDAPTPDDRPLAPPWVSIGGPVDRVDWRLDELQARLDEAKPHVLWVGLGSPLQEQWMSMVAGRLDVGLMIGVGRAFNYMAGALRRCPEWMVNTGLEWAYTFLSEPRRLWRRYLLGNAQFSYLLAQEAITRKINPGHRPAGPRSENGGNGWR